MPGSEESEARRLRTSHKDPLYFVCTIEDRVNVFRHSYFYRAHLLWNRLPLSVRLVRDCDMFSVELRKHLAMSTLPEVEPTRERSSLYMLYCDCFSACPCCFVVLGIMGWNSNL